MAPKQPPHIRLRNDQRWCSSCNQIIHKRRFDRHMRSCKARVTLTQPKEIPSNTSLARNVMDVSPDPIWDDNPVPELVLSCAEGEMQDEFESEEEDPMVERPNATDKVARSTPQEFIRVVHHPHSGRKTSTIIPLDEPTIQHPPSAQPSIVQCPDDVNDIPWAPFRTRADFEFCRLAVSKAFDTDAIEITLRGINGPWASPTGLTLRNEADYQRSLAAARNFGVRFKEKTIVHNFKGKDHTFTFQYRDPWQWVLDIITDPTFAQSINWYPVQKWLHRHGRITRIYDELNTGDRWWEIQDSLPDEPEMPHCFLPLHLWLDKSNVAKTVTKHPIILRAGFLPSSIRNGSGNGGGVLIGYMPIVGEHNSSAENEDDSMTSVEFARFRREVYQKIHHIIFGSICHCSHCGKAVTCGDQILRIIHLGIMILAVDGEEAYCICGTRGVRANYPCPRCLTHHNALTNLTAIPELRTQEKMKATYNKALTLSATAAEKLLRESGLHLVKNAFWKIFSSDPYMAYSYDMLHAMDSGEWGKHQWVLLLENILNEQEQKQLSSNMQDVPRWPSLKHFNTVTGVDFADGNSYRDILKCVVFCLVSILPAQSPVIHCFRILAVIRSIAVLRPVSQEHIVYLKECLPRYEKYCAKLSQMYGKNYGYPKHHSLVHLPFDLQMKGSTDNYTTRPGEGFQQEVQQAYDQTNFRNTESQMTRIDENQEAIARITFAVNNYDASQKMVAEAQAINDGDRPPPVVVNGDHWKFGSQLKKISPEEWESSELANRRKKHVDCRPVQRFSSRLKQFLMEYLPGMAQSFGSLKLTPYLCLYLEYRSLENWQKKQDMLRCNSSFFGQPRYDCVVINTEPISFGRLHALFRLQDSSKTCHDLALITYLEPSSWKPKTKWEGCRVFEEKTVPEFVFVKYLIRGCHMIPAFEKSKKLFYLNDLVDSDAFLRFFLDQRLRQTDI